MRIRRRWWLFRYRWLDTVSVNTVGAQAGGVTINGVNDFRNSAGELVRLRVFLSASAPAVASPPEPSTPLRRFTFWKLSKSRTGMSVRPASGEDDEDENGAGKASAGGTGMLILLVVSRGSQSSESTRMYGIRPMTSLAMNEVGRPASGA